MTVFDDQRWAYRNTITTERSDNEPMSLGGFGTELPHLHAVKRPLSGLVRHQLKRTNHANT